MTTHSVTVELSQEIYQRAKEIARATQRSIEQVVVEWIHPPPKDETNNTLVGLENLSTDQLIQIAQARLSVDNSHRLQKLLTAQQERSLTASEEREAASLVEQEDLITLQKARALFLLKQRGVLPENLTSFLT